MGKTSRMGQPFKGLKNRIKKLKAAVTPQQVEAAALAGGQIIANDAKERVRKRTGTLSRSLHAEVAERTETTVTVEIGTDLEYAAVHEFGGEVPHPGGTPYIVIEGQGAVFMKKDGDYPEGTKFTQAHTIPIPAQPYLRPAFDEKKGEALEEISEAIRDMIKGAT
jgi:HK97 gp10 family phage protein